MTVNQPESDIRKKRCVRLGTLLAVVGVLGAGLAAWLFRDAPRPDAAPPAPAPRQAAAEWVIVPAAPAGEGRAAPVPVVARYKPLPGMTEYKGEPVLWAAEVELSDQLRQPGVLAAAGELSFPVPGLEEPMVIPVRSARTDVNQVLGLSGSPSGTAADFFTMAVDGDKVAAVLSFPVAERSYTLCYDNDTGKQMMLALGGKSRNRRSGDGNGEVSCGGSLPPPDTVDTPQTFGKLSRKKANPSAKVAAVNAGSPAAAVGESQTPRHVNEPVAATVAAATPELPGLGGITITPTPVAGESAEDFAKRAAAYQARVQGDVAAAADISRIDMIIGYDSVAETMLTNYSGSVALTLSMLVAQTNWIYANSAVLAELRLVAAFRTWVPAGMVNLDALYALNNLNDGIMDEIRVLQDAYAADFACVINGGGGNSSWGYNPGALTVIRAESCDVRYLAPTHAHEVGHNLGANHSRHQTDSAEGTTTYATGHHWTHPSAANDGVYYSSRPQGVLSENSGYACTIMTYDGNRIFGEPNNWYMRLPYMSNAALTVNFAPPYTNIAHSAKLGQSETEFPNDGRDNARRANIEAPIAAALKTTSTYEPMLTLNTPASGSVSKTSGHRHYYFDIPAQGAGKAVVTLASSNTGADYFDMGINTPNAPYWAPTVADAEIFLDSDSANETHTINNPQPGRYFVTVHRNTETSLNFTLTVAVSGTGIVVNPPVLTPAGGIYATPVSVKLVSPDGNAIRYTTDGSNPTATNGTLVNTGAIVTVAGTGDLKAVGVRSGYASVIVNQSYEIGNYPIITLENGVARTDTLASSTPTIIYRYVLPAGATVLSTQVQANQAGAAYRDFNVNPLLDPITSNTPINGYYSVPTWLYTDNYDNPEPGVWYFTFHCLSGSPVVTITASHTGGLGNMRDFDGDGKADILWRNINTHGGALWYMDGAARVGAATPPTPDALWKIQDIGDFDGDGRADILWRHATTHQPAIWFMKGAARKSAANVANPGAEWRVAAVADFNGDKRADILWQHRTTHQLSIWFMNGATRQSAGNVAANPSGMFRVVGAADFGGGGLTGGHADILFQNRDTGALTLWTMNGATRQSSRLLGPTPAEGWEAVEAADYYGGGDTASVLFRNVNTHAAYVWRYRNMVRESAVPVTIDAARLWEVGNNRAIDP